MKIAYLVSLYPAQSHTFIQREIEGMRAHGLDIVTYSVRRANPDNVLGDAARAEAANTRWLVPPPPLAFAKSIAWALFTRPQRFIRLGIEAVASSRMGFRDHFLWACYYGEAVLLAWWLTQDKVDHIHCHFGNSGSNTAYLAARLTNLPLSITFHGIDLDDPLRHRHAIKLAYSRFAVCISKFGKSRLMYASGSRQWEKIHVVHCGLPLPKTEAPPPPEKNRLLCVARLSSEKGHFVLLDALNVLRLKGFPFHCTLVGNGPMRQQLEESVEALGLREQITFTGALPPPEVAKQYENTDAVVLASFGEGIPVVLMEAFIHRRPVVATYVGGIPELVRDGVNGCLVAPGSVPQLAKAIERVLTDPGRAREMGDKGYEAVAEGFREEDSARRMAALFRGEQP